MTRKLASVRRISEISSLKNADALELATVDGWNVVVKKGEFSVGDLAIYFEIDSWVPHSIAPFLSKGNEPKVFEGIPGARLKTAKIRGTLSQGLLVKPEEINGFWKVGDVILPPFPEGTDLTETLSVKKWEPDVPPNLRAELAGNFPSFIPKTEQERVQNILHTLKPDTYEVTEKIDGTSCTMFIDQDTNQLRVCSRNRELKLTSTSSVYISMALKMEQTLRNLLRGMVLQGEIFGPRIQRGYKNLSSTKFAVFDVWNCEKERYLSSTERRELCLAYDIPHVPLIEENYTGSLNLSHLLSLADRESFFGGKAEGIVFKSNSNSFKVISNSWLLKEK